MTKLVVFVIFLLCIHINFTLSTENLPIETGGIQYDSCYGYSKSDINVIVTDTYYPEYVLNLTTGVWKGYPAKVNTPRNCVYVGNEVSPFGIINPVISDFWTLELFTNAEIWIIVLFCYIWLTSQAIYLEK